MVNNNIRLLFILGIIFTIFFTEKLFCQQFERGFDFDSVYTKGLGMVNSDHSTAKLYLKKLENYKKEFSPIQQAQTNFLRLKVIYADTNAVKALEKRMFEAPNSLGYDDALIYSAKKYLEKSMPDKAIHLLMDALDTLNKGSEKADFCSISLCEAYRQKQEYDKGIDMLNEILLRKRSVSDINRTYAYNRLAAIYDEWGCNKFNTADSVEKYSNLCIVLSEKINSKSNLALAQNELCYRRTMGKQYDKALELSFKAIKNFDDADMHYSEMNALINQSNIYIRLKEYKLALKAVVDATELCPIEENRNLFMRLYFQFATIYKLKGDYKDAFDFVMLSRTLLDDFYRDRISTQINEQSAKYDLFTKEQRIKEEEQKNEFQKKQLIFLVFILVALCIAFFVSYLYFRLKRKEIIKQKTIEAIIQTEEKERKRIASDLHDGLGPLLSAAKLYFQAYMDAKDMVSKNDIEAKLKSIMENAISDTSRISHNISPQILENYGLIVALENFISDINISENIKFDIKFDTFRRFGLKEELTIYRTLSELINNTTKHAAATLIRINIFISGEMLTLVYEDNGTGFSVEEKMHSTHGMGLKNIKSRIQSLKGNIIFESLEGHGMKVVIKIPYKEIATHESN
ncbi:MAG: sensor histidine kinase [Bacillota bacterium]